MNHHCQVCPRLSTLCPGCRGQVRSGQVRSWRLDFVGAGRPSFLLAEPLASRHVDCYMPPCGAFLPSCLHHEARHLTSRGGRRAHYSSTHLLAKIHGVCISPSSPLHFCIHDIRLTRAARHSTINEAACIRPDWLDRSAISSCASPASNEPSNQKMRASSNSVVACPPSSR